LRSNIVDIKTAFHVKADHPSRGHTHVCSCDLDPMTLTYKLDLDDILKTYLRTKSLRLLKVRPHTGQTSVTGCIVAPQWRHQAS